MSNKEKVDIRTLPTSDLKMMKATYSARIEIYKKRITKLESAGMAFRAEVNLLNKSKKTKKIIEKELDRRELYG